jgi:hypothetical protein
MTALFVSLPVAAQAACLFGPGAGCCSFHHGGLLAGAAYALVAVLGYWVLLQAVKETSVCVKRIGDVLGSILVIVGLVGLLCAVAGHIRGSMGKCCAGGPMMTAPGQPQGMGMMPPGHPSVEDDAAPAQRKAAKSK